MEDDPWNLNMSLAQLSPSLSLFNVVSFLFLPCIIFVVVTKSVLDDFTLKADKRIVVADISKQSRSQVADAGECVQKCEESPGCIALSATSNWAQNSCTMFTEVTRVEDDTSSARWFSKVLGCDVGLDFQVPCYLLEQEAKLTGTLYNKKIIQTF
jgi:hypothetical protein